MLRSPTDDDISLFNVTLDSNSARVGGDVYVVGFGSNRFDQLQELRLGDESLSPQLMVDKIPQIDLRRFAPRLESRSSSQLYLPLTSSTFHSMAS